jgi:hypothetical protein
MPNNRCHGIAMQCLQVLSAIFPRFFTAANTRELDLAHDRMKQVLRHE